MSYISIMTDFGGPVGVMKGVIWRIAPEAKIADISYYISPHNILEGALILDHQAFYFPDNTVHVAVVDPGVGTHRRPIAAQIGPQRFVGPDNGLFTPMYERAERNHWPVQIIHLDKPEYWLPRVSNVFHGRDIFSPVAAHLANGVPLGNLGTPIDDPARIPLPAPQCTDSEVIGQIILIFDNFGNIITNIHEDDIAGLGEVKIQVGGVEIDGLVRTFGERELGSLVAVVGSSGYLMIAEVNGSASRRLKASIGDRVEVTSRS
jgi:S-adenosylmethionine hydrolase